jgi:hypothetical protein
VIDRQARIDDFDEGFIDGARQHVGDDHRSKSSCTSVRTTWCSGSPYLEPYQPLGNHLGIVVVRRITIVLPDGRIADWVDTHNDSIHIVPRNPLPD